MNPKHARLLEVDTELLEKVRFELMTLRAEKAQAEWREKARVRNEIRERHRRAERSTLDFFTAQQIQLGEKILGID